MIEEFALGWLSHLRTVTSPAMLISNAPCKAKGVLGVNCTTYKNIYTLKTQFKHGCNFITKELGLFKIK